jgi:hypothetical protein
MSLTSSDGKKSSVRVSLTMLPVASPEPRSLVEQAREAANGKPFAAAFGMEFMSEGSPPTHKATDYRIEFDPADGQFLLNNGGLTLSTTPNLTVDVVPVGLSSKELVLETRFFVEKRLIEIQHRPVEYGHAADLFPQPMVPVFRPTAKPRLGVRLWADRP